MKFFSKFLKVYRLILEGVSLNFKSQNMLVVPRSVSNSIYAKLYQIKPQYICDNNMQALMNLTQQGKRNWVDYLTQDDSGIAMGIYKYSRKKMLAVEFYFGGTHLWNNNSSVTSHNDYNGLYHGIFNNPIDESQLMILFNNICTTLASDTNALSYAKNNKSFACFFDGNKYQAIIEMSYNNKTNKIQIILWNFFEVEPKDWTIRSSKSVLYSNGRQEIVITGIPTNCLYSDTALDILDLYYPDEEQSNEEKL